MQKLKCFRKLLYNASVMRYAFEPMTEKEAHEVASWRYDPPYDFYDVVNNPEDLDELLDPAKRKDYFSVISNGELIGYFCFGAEAQVPGGDHSGDAIDVGLGLRPDLTGKGLGLGFLEAGLAFARRRFSLASFRLSVAEFNERAIKVYERAGFAKAGRFIQQTNGARHPFISMEREA
ncbi:MAG: GNAT family N-acetyltransferase [Rubrobacteraceae bacterium]